MNCLTYNAPPGRYLMVLTFISDGHDFGTAWYLTSNEMRENTDPCRPTCRVTARKVIPDPRGGYQVREQQTWFAPDGTTVRRRNDSCHGQQLDEREAELMCSSMGGPV